MIVVGVDGSRAALEAAGWAAAEAALRAVPLRVVHALPRWVVEEGSGRYAEVAEWMRENGRTVTDAALERVTRERPDVAAASTLLPGDPRTALIRAAAEADLLVLGNHGIGGVRGLLVGSVAYGVAGRAPCPVVVVRQVPSLPRGEVVAGVDGSAASGPVLDFALAEATLRGAKLRVVHADARPGERTLAERAVAAHPGAQDVEVVPGRPDDVLREAAQGADLLVVGSRGHGTVAGLVLGSVSQALLHVTPCPLVVVPISR